MGKIDLTFNVPSWVESGISKGELNIFNGVIRNRSGQIVHHLKEGLLQESKSKNKNLLIAGAAIAATAAAGYFLYKKINKKETASDAASDLQDKINSYLNSAAQQNISLSSITPLSQEITKFLKACSETGISPEQIFTDPQTAIKLNDIYEAIVDFNSRLAASKFAAYEAPPQIQHTPAETLKNLSTQLHIQESLITEKNQI